MPQRKQLTRLAEGLEVKRGFMDGTAFDHELGHDSKGSRVYPSAAAVKREHHKCVDECGIVEVEVRLVRTVKPAKPLSAIVENGKRRRSAFVGKWKPKPAGKIAGRSKKPL